MSYIRLILMQFRMNCKNWKSLLMMLVFPLILVFVIRGGTGDDELVTAAVLNQDDGEMAEEITGEFAANIIWVGDIEEIEALLRAGEISEGYVFPEDFSDCLKRGALPDVGMWRLEEEEAYTSVNVNVLEQYIREKRKEALYESYGVNYEAIRAGASVEVTYTSGRDMDFGDEFLPYIMLIFFMFSYTNEIASELRKFKNDKVLRRVLCTGSSNFRIISSYVLSKFLFQVVFTTVSFAAISLLQGYEFKSWPVLIYVIAVMSLISISLAIVFVRLIKAPELIAMTSSLVSIVMYIAGLVAIMKDVFSIPGVILTAAQFSPFTWANEMVLNSRIFPHVFVLPLFIIVLLTAGSYKLERFVVD